MDHEIIRKLLASKIEGDVLLGFEYLILKSAENIEKIIRSFDFKESYGDNFIYVVLNYSLPKHYVMLPDNKFLVTSKSYLFFMMKGYTEQSIINLGYSKYK